MKELICFDVDNTLLHSDGPHAYAFNEAFVRSGLKRVSLSKLKKSLDGRKAEAIIKKFFPKLKESEVEEVERIHHSLIKKYSYLAKPISKNIVKVLREVKKEYDLGVVSNSSSETIKELLKKSGIPLSLFKVMIGREMVKHEKPAPDELLKAAKLSHEHIRAIIGDSIFDIQAGKAAKVLTIAVLTGKYSSKDMKKEKADYILKNIDVLPAILEKGKLFK